MATRESRRAKGRRRGQELLRRTLGELRTRRVTLGLSLRAVGAEIGVSKSQLGRIEQLEPEDVGVVRLSEVAAGLGLELSIALHPSDEATHDRGQQAIVKRLRRVIVAGVPVAAEVPFPNPGDPRHWDLLVRLPGQRVGVEAETRIRDVQALVRRMRGRERDGGADEMLLVLSDSAHNRRLVADLREALGERFLTSRRALLRALRTGVPLPGSGVLLI